MSETLEVGGLTFEVRRSSRRQTLGLTVDRGGELRLHAPENTPEQELTRWTHSKLLWVHRALARKEALAPKVRAPEFVSGENFSYLGQNYRLKLVRDAAEPLRFDSNYFWLAEDARSEAEAHFRRWYIRTGRGWLSERTAALARKTGTVAARIAVRDLGFRWGSCGKNGVLFFNWRLLQLPVRLIDYIIVHELVHLQEPHHSHEFWQAIDRALPMWRQLKDALRSDSASFLVFGVNSLRSL
jgi:predicted metal-dependent hydrolase